MFFIAQLGVQVVSPARPPPSEAFYQVSCCTCAWRELPFAGTSMCWSLEVSVGTSVFSYAVALFLIVRGDWTRKFYGGCLLGVCAMQWVEQQVKVWAPKPPQGAPDISA